MNFLFNLERHTHAKALLLIHIVCIPCRRMLMVWFSVTMPYCWAMSYAMNLSRRHASDCSTVVQDAYGVLNIISNHIFRMFQKAWRARERERQRERWRRYNGRPFFFMNFFFIIIIIRGCVCTSPKAISQGVINDLKWIVTGYSMN